MLLKSAFLYFRHFATCTSLTRNPLLALCLADIVADIARVVDIVCMYRRDVDGGEDMTFFAKLDPQKKCLSVYHAQKASQESQELRHVDMFFENQVNSEAGTVISHLYI